LELGDGHAIPGGDGLPDAAGFGELGALQATEASPVPSSASA